MKKVIWQAQELPLKGEYDLIVLGGGTAGALAGIAAAREGLSVLVIEQFGSLGGSATMGQVTPLMSSHIEDISGHCPLGVEIGQRLARLSGASPDERRFDPTLLAFVLEDMATESGCGLLYHSQLAGVIMADDEIRQVVICNKDGLTAYQARLFVDASGDADLAVMAGVDYEIGDHNKINQPVSLRFEMGGIDFTAFHAAMQELGNQQDRYFAMNTPGMAKILQEAHDKGILTAQDIFYFQAFGIPGKPDAMSFNCPELKTQHNVADAVFLTEKQIEGKRAILRLRRFLREMIPGFANSYISHIAPMVGLRESRRIDAVYNLSIADVLGYRKFPDAIISCAYPIDVHGVDDVSLGLQYDPAVPEKERYWQVPWRSLIPKKTSNLLVAGRTAGSDFRAQSAARIQLVCRAMGEAAGLACALALQKNVALKELDPILVHEKLLERGQVF